VASWTDRPMLHPYRCLICRRADAACGAYYQSDHDVSVWDRQAHTEREQRIIVCEACLRHAVQLAGSPLGAHAPRGAPESGAAYVPATALEAPEASYVVALAASVCNEIARQAQAAAVAHSVGQAMAQGVDEDDACDEEPALTAFPPLTQAQAQQRPRRQRSKGA
jgi:hypothetical protein